MKNYLSFTIGQYEKNCIDSGLPLVFIDSLLFLNHSFENVVKNLGENDLDHLSKESDANI